MSNSTWNGNAREGDSSDDRRIFISVTSICLLIVEVLGLVCNSVILSIYYKYSRLRTATNLFILNLALCNLLLATIDIIFSAPSSFDGRWLYGSGGCIGYGFGHQYLMSVAVSTFAVIAFDRFCVITKPVRNLRTFVVKKNHARVLIVLVHVYSFGFTLPLLLGWSDLVPDKRYQTGCYINFADHRAGPLAYTIVSTVFTCILPFVVTLYCYTSIYKSVRKNSRSSILNKKTQKTACGEAALRRTSSQRSLTHARTARMIVVVMFFFLLTWLPSRVTGLCQAFAVPVPALVVYISVFLAKSCVMYNAVVYVFLNHRFRAAFLHMTFVCRDENRLRLTTSVTNNSGRFGDIAPNANDQSNRASRVLSRKNLSQLSIIPVDAIPDTSSTSGRPSDVPVDLDATRGAATAFRSMRLSWSSDSHLVNKWARDGSQTDEALREEGSEMTANNEQKPIMGDDTLDGQKTLEDRQATPENGETMPENDQTMPENGQIAHESRQKTPEKSLATSNEKEKLDMIPGAYCQRDSLVISDEGIDADKFLELDVNSLKDMESG